ncbi:MAG: phosphodiester glycosidase family protein [Bacteroidales bacterium]|nr:phosphodiester glycosidase family protein [Bacteroidales bacterium]
MKNIIVLIICLAIGFQAKAGDMKKDSTTFVNADWKVTELRRGATAMHAQMQMFDSQQSISIIRYPARKFRTRLINSPGDLAGKTSGIGMKEGAYAAINGGYFDMAQLLPCVYFRTGEEVFGHTSPSEAFRVNGVIGTKDRKGRKGRKVMIAPCSPSEYEDVTGKWFSVMASGPMLMDEGEILVPEFTETDENGKGIDAFNDYRHPRSVIGYDGKGYVYLVVIDGRHPGKGDGASIYETALICRFLGMTDAINLDGGGSSSLWSSELGVLSHPSDNKAFDHEGERTVPDIIGVFR